MTPYVMQFFACSIFTNVLLNFAAHYFSPLFPALSSFVEKGGEANAP
jgi:hypothetical protein